jgi:DNA-binding transcriptional LysR family regulator
LPNFLKRYPEMTFDFTVTNRIVDLIGENMDISLRIGPLPDSGLVVRKIADLSRIVCASPDYIARHGRPTKPADLSEHACLTLSRIPGSATWPFRLNGKLVTVDVKGPVAADSAEMLLRLAIEGVGILHFSEHVVADSIRKGLLEPLLRNAQDTRTYPLCALMPPGRHQVPKVKVFLDFLAERLGSRQWFALKRDRRRV